MITSETTDDPAPSEFKSVRLTMMKTPDAFWEKLALSEFGECSTASGDYGSPPTRVTRTMITVRHMMTIRRRNDAAAAFPMSSDVKAFFQIR